MRVSNSHLLMKSKLQKKLNVSTRGRLLHLMAFPLKFLQRIMILFRLLLLKCTMTLNNNLKFPDSLKLADITPTHKKDDTTHKQNYRPLSILPSVSKLFERNMFEQISDYIDNFSSPYLCGFRKGYSTQHSLVVMLET